MLDALTELLPPPKEPEDVDQPALPDALRVAIIGRPNVGKSSLVNALVCMPHPPPGALSSKLGGVEQLWNDQGSLPCQTPCVWPSSGVPMSARAASSMPWCACHTLRLVLCRRSWEV